MAETNPIPILCHTGIPHKKQLVATVIPIVANKPAY